MPCVYIHKEKAEKQRAKMLNEQTVARRQQVLLNENENDVKNVSLPRNKSSNNVWGFFFFFLRNNKRLNLRP